jgi:hypothetical protein
LNRKYKKLKRFLIIFPVVIILTSGIFVAVTYKSNKWSEYLSPTKVVEANTLIIEGWLPDYAIKMVTQEIQRNPYNLIITSGIKSYGLDYCTIGMNGYLIFYPQSGSLKKKSYDNHLIEIDAHSEMDGKYRTHMSFFVNDSLITDFTVNMKKQKYSVNWKGSLESIDSMMIQFDNDMIDDFGDRNLYVKEIVIDKETHIPYRYNSVYDVGQIGGNNRIYNNYNSSAEIFKNKLIAAGLDPIKINVITGKRTGINRTLTSVGAIKRWMKSSSYNIKSLNIVSLGIHSRRTWLTYKRVLGKSYDIGIISLQEMPTSKSKQSPQLNMAKESLSLVYYWIILLPYLLFS